jgi:hypothetical protein
MGGGGGADGDGRDGGATVKHLAMSVHYKQGARAQDHLDKFASRPPPVMRDGGREGQREGGREGGTEGGREGGREGGNVPAGKKLGRYVDVESRTATGGRQELGLASTQDAGLKGRVGSKGVSSM